MSQPFYDQRDPRFLDCVVPYGPMEEIATGCRWAEGPVWFGDHGCLLFSDIPNERILRWTPGLGVSTFRQPSNFANGHTRDGQGRLVSCEHGGRRVTRTEADGRITVLADSHDGRRLNSPNDVVVASDGAVWFTDPTYGILSDYEGYRAEPEQGARHVFRLDPSGTLAPVVSDFAQPNGLCFSPDERLLYIADSGASHDPGVPPVIRRFRVTDRGLSGGEVFATLDNGLPDGIRCDMNGNVWSSAGDGVHVFAPDGTLLGKILVPQRVANLTFGGPRRNRLFITATTSVYLFYVAATGAQRP
ncbi:MAG: SMP-30/gluconolactonase/LRE family protein [Rhodobacteraceae bacterium]|jgi:gluconolactonase|nr:SMP-30/gluconolactonase/LRE family protein [Paracoccaceae bacterium]